MEALTKVKSTVVVTINHAPVAVPAPRISGLEVKQAAIAAGLPITTDFVLSVVKPNGRHEVVANDQIITVNKNSVFVAVSDDDDS